MDDQVIGMLIELEFDDNTKPTSGSNHLSVFGYASSTLHPCDPVYVIVFKASLALRLASLL